nr:MAG TPA: hypothetical protein [Caudoviricetes sp.]
MTEYGREHTTTSCVVLSCNILIVTIPRVRKVRRVTSWKI